MAYEDEVLADNPITYFRLDETGGATTANDLGSANNDGTYQNAPTQGVTSPITSDASDASSIEPAKGAWRAFVSSAMMSCVGFVAVESVIQPVRSTPSM